MWKFRPIGDYYELLVDGKSLYLCKSKDTIVQALLDDLCDRHNKEIMQYENTQPFVEDCNVLYQGGYEDGQAYGYDLGYEDGYKDGYKRAVADIDSTRG